jgi:uncharacterized protein with ParB-like and HNH nuclease domain
MKINIENTPRSIIDLFFNDGGTSGAGEFTCIGNNERVSRIVIPIYQREYDWGKEELLRLLINTNEYIEDLQHSNIHNSYFVGTVLLEKIKDKNNSFELIDGQQRLTTSFLLNFVGYKIAIERCLNIPSFTPKKYAAELTNRLNKIKLFEDRLFTYKQDKLPDDWGLIFSTEFLEIEDDLESGKKITDRLNINEVLNYRETKIFHENPDQHELFLNALRNTKVISEDGVLGLSELTENEFNERSVDIFNYFAELQTDPNTENDQKLDEIIKKIEDFSSAISFCVLVSDNPDDSFKLFEVLNSTGRLLTIIDKLKNHLYEKIVKTDKTLNNEMFNLRWKELIDLQSRSGSSNITLDLARSELSLIKDKFYEYFSNKTIFINSKSFVRDELFIKEDNLVFFDRITTISKITHSIYSVDCYESTNTPHTLAWYYRVMNKINYDWGRQVFLGTIILTNHLGAPSAIESGLWDKPLIDNKSTISTLSSIEKFLVNLSDILFKIGAIGIVNGLSSKKLPTTSQLILKKIIDFVKNNQKEVDLKNLFNDIKGVLTLYIDENKDDFQRNLRYLTYSKSSDRNYMTLLLYVLYNKGKSASSLFEKPSLEHFESRAIPPGNKKLYYSESDRDDIIHSFGNMILMKRNHNSKLGNIPVVEKIKKIQTDPEFINENFYGSNVFRNLIPNAKINGNVAPYSNFPKIDKTTAYDTYGAPKKNLFSLRTDFYIENLTNMICSKNEYVLSGDAYIIKD